MEEEERPTKTEDGGGSFKPVITKTQIAGILHMLAIVLACPDYELECVVMISLH